MYGITDSSGDKIIEDTVKSRTFRYFHALYSFVVDCAGSLLDELVSLDANVKNLRALYRELDELFDRRINDICSSLWKCQAMPYRGVWSTISRGKVGRKETS